MTTEATMDFIEEQELDNLVTLRLLTKNTRLAEVRQSKGLTQKEAAHQAGISVLRYQEIERLRRSPIEEDMTKIASFFRKPPDYLFPEVLIKAIEAGVFDRRQSELAAPEIISLTEAQQLRLSYDGETALIEEISQTLLREQIEVVLQTIDPKEREVIRLRFGLDGSPSRTLEEVGAIFGVTGERIRQIEGKALRKLRHPARSRVLKGYLD